MLIKISRHAKRKKPGHVAYLVAIPAADPEFASLIQAQSHTFVEIDYEIISTVADSRRVVLSYKRKYAHKVLLNRLVKLAQKKK